MRGSIAVVGAGSIGVAWSIVFARAGHPVALYEPDDDRRRQACAEVERRLEALEGAGLLDEPSADVRRRIEPVGDLGSAVEGAVYVQECAPEDLEVKRGLFSLIDRVAPPAAVLASSSSAIPPSKIAAGIGGAARALVAHPGNPPYLLPIVELVPAPFTAPETVDRAARLLAAAGMSPVRLHREVEGFVFNRLQGAVLREAYCLVRDGVVEPEDLDRVMRDGLGRRWSLLGPFETVELNTRGGIDAHAERLGPAYARMGAERGQHDPWTEEMVAKVSKAVQSRFPRRRWRDHVAWRDLALMSLESFRRRTPLLSGPPVEQARPRNRLRSRDEGDPSPASGPSGGDGDVGRDGGRERCPR